MITSAHSQGQKPDWAVCFSAMALALLGVRFVQGFIFWGGASRRMIYDYQDIAGINHAVKLDFEAAGFVANKMVHALPGVLWIGGPIEWLLSKPDLVYLSVWFWTLAELIVGLGLIFGLLTRALALASVGMNISLMLVFGWMGSTCLDEWTMAVSGFAMSAAIFVAGGGRLSLDRLLQNRLGTSGLIVWLMSGALPAAAARRASLTLAVIGAVFTVGSYHILFGAVVSPLHPRVNYHNHHISLSNIELAADAGIMMDAYVDAGPDTGAAYVIAARLQAADGTVAAEWDGETLADLAPSAIVNAYPYVWASHFKTERYGFSGKTGGKARLSLPPPASGASLSSGTYELLLEAIDGQTWSAKVLYSG